MFKSSFVDISNAIVVRWGTREDLHTSRNTIVYNRSSSISNITNKKLSRELFIGKGVNTPKMITHANIESNDLPIIARPFVHSKGRNFIVLNTVDDFNRHYNPDLYYYSAFVDKVSEYRIHTAHSKVLAVMKKHPVANSIAWNRAVSNSDPFEYIPWNEVEDLGLYDVMVEAIKAVKAVDADFGGVDVIVDKNNKPYVLEVNSAPTLNTSPYVSKRWGQYFDWLFRAESRRDHWDYTKFKKAKSLIWKNYQLDESTRDN
jgi:carbamoylphosphate synthase large subunit